MILCKQAKKYSGLVFSFKFMSIWKDICPSKVWVSRYKTRLKSQGLTLNALKIILVDIGDPFMNALKAVIIPPNHEVLLLICHNDVVVK